MRIAIVQMRAAVRTRAADTRAILAVVDGARAAGARVLVTSGGALGGLQEPAAPGWEDVLAAVAAASTELIVIAGITGGARRSGDARCAVIAGGRYVLMTLAEPELLEFGGRRLAAIASDDRAMAEPVAGIPAGAGAPATSAVDALLVVAAEPYLPGVHAARGARLAALARGWRCPIVQVNAIGYDGHQAYDGASLVVGADGRRLQQLPAWSETLALTDVLAAPHATRGDLDPDPAHHMHAALVEALRVAVAETGAGEVEVVAPHDRASEWGWYAAADVVGAARVRTAAPASEPHRDAALPGVRTAITLVVRPVETGDGAFGISMDGAFAISGNDTSGTADYGRGGVAADDSFATGAADPPPLVVQAAPASIDAVLAARAALGPPAAGAANRSARAEAAP